MFGGIVTVSVGHCHPKVNEALVKQVNTLWHTTNIYLHPKVHEYAVKLVETLPDQITDLQQLLQHTFLHLCCPLPSRYRQS